MKLFIQITILLQFSFVGKAQTDADLLKVDSLKKVIAETVEDSTKINCWRAWSKLVVHSFPDTFLVLSNKIVSLAEQNLEGSLNKEETFFYKKSLVRGWTGIADYYKYKDQEKALEATNKSLEICEEIQYKSGFTENYNILGILAAFDGDFESSLEYFELFKSSAEETKNVIAQGNALTNLGVVANNLGDYGKAIGYYNEGLKLYESQNDRQGMGTSLYNIGLIYINQEDFEIALDYIQQCYDIGEEIGNKIFKSSALSLMGVAYSRTNRVQKAIESYEQSLEIKRELGDTKGIGNSLSNLGFAYIKLGKYKKALALTQEGLKIREEISDAQRIPTSLNNIGTIYREQGNLSKALEYSKRSLKLAQEMNSVEYMQNAFENLYKIYKKQGTNAKALENYESYITFRDSLLSEKNQKEVIRKEYEYTYEKQALADSIQFAQIQQISDAELAAEKAITQQQKQRSSFLLIGLVAALGLGGYIYNRYRFTEKQKKTIEENNIQLQQLNATKDKFFGIIAHDIRSPIAALDGVGEQMDYYLKNDKKDKLERLAGRVDSTAKRLNGLLDNLLNWALLQQGVIPYHPKALKVKDVVDHTFEMFSSNAEAKKIILESNLDPDLTVYADESAINTIFRNLISNAIKFTLQSGTVTVSTETVGDKIFVSINDTGTGISAEKVDKLFSLEKKSVKGTAGEKGTGLGLNLVKELVELNKGVINVVSELNKGSTFKVGLPVVTA